MSYARNHVTRPPHNDPSNWLMHETWTTDGSGWVSSGFAEKVVPGGVVVSKDMATDIFNNMPMYGHGPTLVHSLVGSTLKVLGGPGAGFSSVVTGWEAGTRTLTLETETDQWFRPGNCTLVQPVSYDIAGIRLHSSKSQHAGTGGQHPARCELLGPRGGGVRRDEGRRRQSLRVDGGHPAVRQHSRRRGR